MFTDADAELCYTNQDADGIAAGYVPLIRKIASALASWSHVHEDDLFDIGLYTLVTRSRLLLTKTTRPVSIKRYLTCGCRKAMLREIKKHNNKHFPRKWETVPRKLDANQNTFDGQDFALIAKSKLCQMDVDILVFQEELSKCFKTPREHEIGSLLLMGYEVPEICERTGRGKSVVFEVRRVLYDRFLRILLPFRKVENDD